MSKTIVLDAGHGGTDGGAVNGSRYEKDDNFRLTMAVSSKLSEQGQKVILTRTSDTAVSLAERTRMANAAGADLFVSLHRNSFVTTVPNGVEIWVYTTAGAVDVGAAAEVLEQLAVVGVQNNRGVKKGNYHVLRESKMTSMPIELGFISNAQDNALFDSHFDAYATAITRGVLAALGEPYKEPGKQEEAPAQGLYRVQVGAFKVRAGAESFLQTVRGMGLQAFLVEPAEAKE